MTSPLLITHLDLPNRRQGKVRDLYDVELPNGDAALLIVATDRISAFDIVLGNGLPGKGRVLTQISKFWFSFFESEVQHHLLSTDVADIPGLSNEERLALTDRVMLCRKTSVVPIECIARGYLAGSGYKDYLRTGLVCGIPLPAGLANSDKLDQPLFTPSTKAEMGAHDENISYAQGVEIAGEELMAWLRETTLSLYQKASSYALSKGIILADTKFEFGLISEHSQPILIDEIFTPDSSRFWLADEWESGREQNSFDKQFVRNYLETLVAQNQWDKQAPGPELPADVIEQTMARYLEAYERLTGNQVTL